MAEPQREDSSEQRSKFEEAGKEPQLSIVQEFLLFIIENKAWRMVPIVVVLGLVGLLVVLSSSGAAPFIYTLF